MIIHNVGNKVKGEAVHFPVTISNQNLVFRPIELCLITWRAFMPDGCFLTDMTTDVFINLP